MLHVTRVKLNAKENISSCVFVMQINFVCNGSLTITFDMNKCLSICTAMRVIFERSRQQVTALMIANHLGARQLTVVWAVWKDKAENSTNFWSPLRVCNFARIGLGHYNYWITLFSSRLFLPSSKLHGKNMQVARIHGPECLHTLGKCTESHLILLLWFCFTAGFIAIVARRILLTCMLAACWNRRQVDLFALSELCENP